MGIPDKGRKVDLHNFLEDVGVSKMFGGTKKDTGSQKTLLLKTTNDQIISKIKKSKHYSSNAAKIEGGAKILWSTIKGICVILLIIYLSLNIQYVAEYGSDIKCFSGMSLTDIFFPSDETKYPYTRAGYNAASGCEIKAAGGEGKFKFKVDIFNKLHSCPTDSCPGWPYTKCNVPTCTTSLGDFFNLIFIDSFYDAELIYNKFVSTMLYLLNFKHINFLPVFILYLIILILFIILLTHIMPIGLTILQIIAFFKNMDLWNSVLYVKLMFLGMIIVLIFIVSNFLYTIWKIILLVFRLTIEPALIGADISQYLSKYCIVFLIIVGIYVAIRLVEFTSVVL